MLSEVCSDTDCSICLEDVNNPNPDNLQKPKGPKIVLIPQDD